MKDIEYFKKGRIIALIKESFFKTGYSTSKVVEKPFVEEVLKW